jgi:hypothetical protein
MIKWYIDVCYDGFFDLFDDNKCKELCITVAQLAAPIN